MIWASVKLKHPLSDAELFKSVSSVFIGRSNPICIPLACSIKLLLVSSVGCNCITLDCLATLHVCCRFVLTVVQRTPPGPASHMEFLSV